MAVEIGADRNRAGRQQHSASPVLSWRIVLDTASPELSEESYADATVTVGPRALVVM
jgi:hypothetical protein